MIKGKKVLAMIPARGGSKGLPGKNIKPICGKPLIVWSIEQALKSKHVDRVLVSTDSEEIAQTARKGGADVPFLRPPELALDSSPTSDAIMHALEWLENKGEFYEYLVLLEPTSPLRKAGDIDKSLGLLAENGSADSLVSVGKVHTEHPMIVKRISGGYVTPYMEDIAKIHQRQQADDAYFPYGVVYMTRISAFKEKRTFYTDKTLPYFIERWQNYEIDDEIDFVVIENILQLKKGEING